MRPSLSICLVLATGSLIGADIVVLDNGQRIAGVIDSKVELQPGQVAINTGSGIIRIAKGQVKNEDLGYDSKRARLKEDDLVAVVDLAHWCRVKGMNAHALELLTLAVALPGVELPERALHARLVDELKGPEEAFELYVAYRKAGGNDGETIARLQTLEKAKSAADNAPYTAAQSVPAIPALTAAAEPGAKTASAKPLTNLGDGLETKGWVPEILQYSNPVEAKVIDLTTADGASRALEITFKSGKMDKAAVRRNVNNLKLGVSDNSVLTFWAQNPGDKPINISIAVKTGDKWEFHESPMMRVKPGDFQQLKFDLKASNFKSVATSWANTGKVANLDDIKELQLLIYNKADGSLIITNMGFPPKQDM